MALLYRPADGAVSLNTGLLLMRNRPAVRALLERHVKRLLGTQREVTGGENQLLLVSDGFGSIPYGSTHTNLNVTVFSIEYRVHVESDPYKHALRRALSIMLASKKCILHFNGWKTYKELMLKVAERRGLITPVMAVQPSVANSTLLGAGCCRAAKGEQLLAWKSRPTSVAIAGRSEGLKLSIDECAKRCASRKRCTHFEINTWGEDTLGAAEGRGQCWIFDSGGLPVQLQCDKGGRMLCFERMLENQVVGQQRRQQSILFAFVAFQDFARMGLLADSLDSLAAALKAGSSLPDIEALLVTDEPACAVATLAPDHLKTTNSADTDMTSIGHRDSQTGAGGSHLWGHARIGTLRISIVQAACVVLGNVLHIKKHKMRLWEHARRAELLPSMIIYMDTDVIVTSPARLSALFSHLEDLTVSAPPPAMALFINFFGGGEPYHGGLFVTWADLGEQCLLKWSGAFLKEIAPMARDQGSLGRLQCAGGISLLPSHFLGATFGTAIHRSRGPDATVAKQFAEMARTSHAFVHFTINDALSNHSTQSGAMPGALRPARVGGLFRVLGLGRRGGAYACIHCDTKACAKGLPSLADSRSWNWMNSMCRAE